MDFDLTEEQRSLRDSIVEFARRELNDDVVERDKSGTFSRDSWKKCADLGLLGLPVPEEYGGAGADALTIVVALEALGYGCTDNGLDLLAQRADVGVRDADRPLRHRGAEAALPAAPLRRLADRGARDERARLGLGRRSPRDDRAHATATGYVLNGSKTFVTNAPVADLFLVFATTDRSSRASPGCARSSSSATRPG